MGRSAASVDRSRPNSQSLQVWPTLRVTRTLIRFPLDHPEPTTSTLGCPMMHCLPAPKNLDACGSSGTVGRFPRHNDKSLRSLPPPVSRPLYQTSSPAFPLHGRSRPNSRSLQGWPTLRVTQTLIHFPSDHPEPTTSTLGYPMMRCLLAPKNLDAYGSGRTVGRFPRH